MSSKNRSLPFCNSSLVYSRASRLDNRSNWSLGKVFSRFLRLWDDFFHWELLQLRLNTKLDQWFKVWEVWHLHNSSLCTARRTSIMTGGGVTTTITMWIERVDTSKGRACLFRYVLLLCIIIMHYPSNAASQIVSLCIQRDRWVLSLNDTCLSAPND